MYRADIHLDAVEALRRQAVIPLLKTVQDNVDALLSADSVPLSLCKRGQSAQNQTASIEEMLDCEARMLGSLQRELHKHNLWPLPESKDLAVSAAALHDVLKTIGQPRSGVTEHSDCALKLDPAWGLGAGSVGEFAELKYTATEAEAEYMAKQRALVGVVPTSGPRWRILRKQWISLVG